MGFNSGFKVLTHDVLHISQHTFFLQYHPRGGVLGYTTLNSSVLFYDAY